MARREYLTAPLPTQKMPSSVPYILTNEAAERFAFYGMSSILVVFMTGHLLARGGALAVMGAEPAKEWFHWFTAAVYFMAIAGAIISDVWLGKFKTIIAFSLVYCVGFVLLALDHTRVGLAGGLILIALGSGIIKPCVSANVGDQFGPSNKHRIEKVYSWFYFSINAGAAISMYKCPEWLDTYGPTVGFGIPAGVMVIATAAYWLGRYKLVHIPPAGRLDWAESLDREQAIGLGKLCTIFLFVSMFFALFYQSQAAWVLQAEKMNLTWLGKTWKPAQVQFVNSVLVVLLIPLFAYLIYPGLNRVWTMTPLRKIGIGMFVTAAGFLVPIWIETRIGQGGQPSIGWQFLAYLFLTAAEIMVSITVLEFAYTQAPKKMKSLIQALNLLSISLGNTFSAVVNHVIKNPDGTSKLPGARYYWFFALAMLATAILFIPLARWYKQREYIQDEAPAEVPSQARPAPGSGPVSPASSGDAASS
jgi:POT family proton-dependent oligopeptide transporter